MVIHLKRWCPNDQLLDVHQSLHSHKSRVSNYSNYKGSQMKEDSVNPSMFRNYVSELLTIVDNCRSSARFRLIEFNSQYSSVSFPQGDLKHND